MKKTYFIGDGPEAKAVVDEAFSKVEAFEEIIRGFLKDFLNCVGAVRNGLRGAVLGIAFEKDHKLTDEQCQSLGVGQTLTEIDGKWFYKPNKRSSKGKELQKRINGINKQHVDFSKYVAAKLGIDRTVIDGRMLRSTSVGAKDGKLFVSIPGEPGDDKGASGRDTFPEIPSWFRAPEGDEAIFFLSGK